MKEGRSSRDSANCTLALKYFGQAASLAAKSGQLLAQSRAELATSGCEIRLFRYRSALGTLARAAAVAKGLGNRDLLGAIAGNVAVIYSQLGDYDAAESASLRAVDYLAVSDRHDYFSLALVNLGEIEFGLGRTLQARTAFSKAIEVTKKFGLKELEALAEDNFGIWLVLQGNLREAEDLLKSAASIREKIGDSARLKVSFEHLAELEEQKGGASLSNSLRSIDKALEGSNSLSGVPRYYPLHVRGRIYLKLGRTQAALGDFRRAVAEADIWRRSALPGDATNTRTVAQLTSVYRDFAHLTAALALSTKNQSLVRESFEVLARHRVSTLSEQMTRAYREQLMRSPEYFSLLQRLQKLQSYVSLATDARRSLKEREALQQTRSQLHDLENHLGLEESLSSNSEHLDTAVLTNVQARLHDDTALLSISLGDPTSYLWTVTKTDVKLYPLPSRQVIAQQANSFKAAVQHSAQRETLKIAADLISQSLFSRVPGAVAKKSEWLIAADGELMDLMPFAALPDAGHIGSALIAHHSLRILPGAMLPARKSLAPSSGGYAGVGDPIYNRADSRLEKKAHFPDVRQDVQVNILARLAASRKELATSASASGLPVSWILTGRDASLELLRRNLLAKPPKVLHFAVHVVSPDGHPGEAALALSLSETGYPELLTSEAASTLRISGALVVLSGCSSQQGEIVAGSGIVGLSRSWLLAGADAVVVSAWPTPDDSGPFFSSFYKAYHELKGTVSHRAALALEKAQLHMTSMNATINNPSDWAAYSVVSRE